MPWKPRVDTRGPVAGVAKHISYAHKPGGAHGGGEARHGQRPKRLPATGGGGVGVVKPGFAYQRFRG